jgi:hypothetical protein
MMVVLDTNFITLPTQFKVDIFGEIEKRLPGSKMVTVPQVIEELKRLGPDGKVGLEMLEKKGVEVIRKKGETDDALLELAVEKNAILCTNDKELKRRATARRVPVMFMRKKKILEISGGLNV